MKKIFTLIFILVLCFRAESSNVPSANPGPAISSIATPVSSALNITTAKTKDIEKLLGRKLKLKEKLAIKVFQWKYKKGLKAKKAEDPAKKGKTAMILGIIGIAALFIPYVSLVAIPCAILAIIFGNQAKKADPNNGQAKAGVILGIVTLGLIALALILVIAIIASGGFWFG